MTCDSIPVPLFIISSEACGGVGERLFSQREWHSHMQRERAKAHEFGIAAREGRELRSEIMVGSYVCS